MEINQKLCSNLPMFLVFTVHSLITGHVAALHVFPNYKYFEYYSVQKKAGLLSSFITFSSLFQSNNHDYKYGSFDWNREENVMKELNVPAFFVLGNILTIYRLGKHAKQLPEL